MSNKNKYDDISRDLTLNKNYGFIFNSIKDTQLTTIPVYPTTITIYNGTWNIKTSSIRTEISQDYLMSDRGVFDTFKKTKKVIEDE